MFYAKSTSTVLSGRHCCSYTFILSDFRKYEAAPSTVTTGRQSSNHTIILSDLTKYKLPQYGYNRASQCSNYNYFIKFQKIRSCSSIVETGRPNAVVIQLFCQTSENTRLPPARSYKGDSAVTIQLFYQTSENTKLSVISGRHSVLTIQLFYQASENTKLPHVQL